LIAVQDIFLRLNSDLALKGLGGFANNASFNRAVNEVQGILFEYYAERFRGRQKMADALGPFQTFSDRLIIAGVFTLPDDYRHLLDASYVSVTNTSGEPTVSYSRLREKGPDEDRQAYRRPTVGKPKTYAYEFSAAGNFIYPSSLSGYVRVKYLRAPVDAERKIVANATTDDEDYTATGTINLEWPESEFTNFISLLLYYKGVEIRDTDLAAFVSGKIQLQDAKTR
jgi:hypothetical protein